jgi:hypothetical protein
MLRRLIFIVFAFLIASCAGVFLLVMAALFDPATREAGLVATMNGIFFIIDEAMRHGDPEDAIAAFFAVAQAIAIAVCVAPLAVAVATGEAMGVRQLIWYSGISGVFAGASPWIARAARGLDRAREATPIEARIALLFFLTGVFTGFVYWLIAVPKDRARTDQ